jgi:hypothetical protein
MDPLARGAFSEVLVVKPGESHVTRNSGRKFGKTRKWAESLQPGMDELVAVAMKM